MPMSGGALYIPGELLPAVAIRTMMSEAFDAEIVRDPADGVRGLGPATYWRVDGGPYAGRCFGLIAAMTENFCDSCNRLRLSGTGQLHACLARDESGDLRAALRDGGAGALEAAVRRLLGEKEDGHRFALDGSGGPTKAMISIGG
jgi:cyclic pyranopterin phosphate synthase